MAEKWANPHDPNAVLDYGRNWAAWLGVDTIDTSIWIIAPETEGDENPVVEEASSNTATTTTLWLSGGTPGNKYAITNRITTAGERTDDRTAILTCKER